MRVLDVGCGAGFATLGMARLVGDQGQVIAVDVQPQMLAKVAKRSDHAGLGHRIKTHLSHAAGLGVEGQFDFVNAFYMVHEVPDIENFLRQIHACLRPDGHFLIVEPKFHVSLNKFNAMLQLIDKVGFKEVERLKLLASYAVVLTKKQI